MAGMEEGWKELLGKAASQCHCLGGFACVAGAEGRCWSTLWEDISYVSALHGRPMLKFIKQIWMNIIHFSTEYIFSE